MEILTKWTPTIKAGHIVFIHIKKKYNGHIQCLFQNPWSDLDEYLYPTVSHEWDYWAISQLDASLANLC